MERKEEMMVEKINAGIVVDRIKAVIIFPIAIGILLTTSIMLMVVITYMYIKKNRRKQEFLSNTIYQTPHTATTYYQHDRVVEDTDPIYHEPEVKNSVDNFPLWKQRDHKYENLPFPTQEVIYSIPGEDYLTPPLPFYKSFTSSISLFKTSSHSRSDNVEDFITFCPIYSSEEEDSNVMK